MRQTCIKFKKNYNNEHIHEHYLKRARKSHTKIICDVCYESFQSYDNNEKTQIYTEGIRKKNMDHHNPVIVEKFMLKSQMSNI